MARYSLGVSPTLSEIKEGKRVPPPDDQEKLWVG